MPKLPELRLNRAIDGEPLSMMRLVELLRLGHLVPQDWMWELQYDKDGFLYLKIHQPPDTVFYHHKWLSKTITFDRAERFIDVMFGVECLTVGEQPYIPEPLPCRGASHNSNKKL